MRKFFIIGFILLAATACRAPASDNDQLLEALPAQSALPLLTMAELHRTDFSGGKDCELLSDGSWQCFQRAASGRTFTFQPAPENIAPFAAQIYLHPDYTTEEYLIEKGIKNRPLWALRHVCGATLIAPNWAVTAAHCFPKPEVDSSYGIRLGLNNIANDQGFLYRVQEVVRRDPPGTPTRKNDIALVRFDPTESNLSTVSQRDLASMAPKAPPILTALFQKGEALLSVIDGYGNYYAINPTTWDVIASTEFTSRLQRISGTDSLFSTVPDEGVSITPLDGSKSIMIPHPGVTDSFLIDQDTVIVSWSKSDGLIKATSRKARQAISQYTATEGLRDVLPIGNSTLLFTNDELGHIRIIDLFHAEDQSPLSYERPFIEGVELEFVTKDGRVAVFKDTRTDQLELVDTQSNTTFRYINRHGFTHAFSRDGTRLVVNYPGQLLVVDIVSGLDLASVPTFNTDTWITTQFFDNGRHLIIRGYDQLFADIWDIESISRIARLTAPRPLEKIQFLDIFEERGFAYVTTKEPNHDALRMGVNPEMFPEIHRAYIFNLKDGKQIAQLSSDSTSEASPVQAAEVRSVPRLEVFGESQRLLSWRNVGRSKIWDIDDCLTATEVCSPSMTIDHDVRVKDVSITPDERHLIAITEAGSVQIWDTENASPVQTIFHGGTVEGAKTWNNGERIMTYGTNGFIRFWDIKSGVELSRLSLNPPKSSMGENAPDIISNSVAAVGGPGETPSAGVVTYVKLDETGEGLFEGAGVRAFGWGAHNSYVSGARSQSLREAGLQVISKEICRAPENYGPRDDLHERVFCARDTIRKTCVGDSGGPIIQGVTMEDATLVGIVSWGGAACKSDGKPGVYTRIASHSEWIKDTLGDDLPID